jgi:two-component system chemotaxis response regulator CheB
MPGHDVIVIGASAGGVEAISRVVSGLPADLRAAVLVVLHLSRGRSVLPEILSRAGPLVARHPVDGERLVYGRIYVAPPDHHMIVDGEQVRLLHGPSENGVRPAVDPLFRSAARSFGSRVVGVVLTGALDDGTAGLAAVREAGGVSIVQDPSEAFAPSMPLSAIEFVKVDHILTLAAIPRTLVELTMAGTSNNQPPDGPQLRRMEPDLGAPLIAIDPDDRPGKPSVFTCPECHGTLWEADEDSILRFRCRVGHVYSPDSMLAAQTDSVDRALWAALRSLEERAALNRKMAHRAADRHQPWVSNAFEKRARIAQEHSDVIRGLLEDRTWRHVVPDHTAAPSDIEAVPEPQQEAQ